MKIVNLKNVNFKKPLQAVRNMFPKAESKAIVEARATAVRKEVQDAFKANENYAKYREIQAEAVRDGIRMSLQTSGTPRKPITLVVASNKTLINKKERVTAFKNIFKTKKNKQPLQTMDAKTAVKSLRQQVWHYLGGKNRHPISTTEFKPEDHYMGRVRMALSAVRNDLEKLQAKDDKTSLLMNKSPKIKTDKEISLIEKAIDMVNPKNLHERILTQAERNAAKNFDAKTKEFHAQVDEIFK